MFSKQIRFLFALLTSNAQIKKMTLARIFIISLLCYKGLINCQTNPRRLDFRLQTSEFFNYNIKVDYSSCQHNFYFYDDEGDYQSENEEYELEYEGDEYNDDVCLRYNVLNLT